MRWGLFSGLVAICSFYLCVSCGSSGTDIGVNSSRDGQTAAQNKDKLVVHCSFDGYSYLTFLNGEPVAGGNSAAFYSTQLYPVRFGSNNVEVRLFFPEHVVQPEQTGVYAKRSHYELSVVTQFATNTPIIWAGTGIVTESSRRPFTDTVWSAAGMVTNAQPPGDVFDVLPANKAEVESQCREMSFAIAKLIQARDKDKIKRALSLSEEEFESSHSVVMSPDWAYVDGVTNESQILVVSGRKFVLAVCGNSGKVTAGRSLARFKDARSATVIRFDQILFAHSKGQWLVRGLNDNWSVLDVNLLPNRN